MRNRLFVLLVSLFIFGQCSIAQDKVVKYRNGLVVCATKNAAQVGLDVLKKGGNAVDAAVAVQFALAVTHPEAGNIGGGGFMVFRSSKGEYNTLDFREKAPAGASKDMFLDSAGNIIPNSSIATHQASGVPGSVAGMAEAHKKYGKLKWAELVQPAIDLARKGFVITARFASDLNAIAPELKAHNLGTYLAKQKKWQAGDTVVQEDLAKTLELIRDKGRDGFYKGEVADKVIAEMKRGGGLITKQDLQDYYAVWRRPLTGNYKRL